MQKIKKKKEEEEKKFKPFIGTGYTIDSYYNNMNNIEGFEDDEMRQAYELSLLEYAAQLKKEIPPEPENGYSFHINVNGKIYNRKFAPHNKIGDIVKFIQSEIPTLNHVLLYENFPYKTHENEDITIKDSGLGFNQILFGKIIH